MYSEIQKRVFTPLRELPTQIIEAIDHFPTQQWYINLRKRPDVTFAIL